MVKECVLKSTIEGCSVTDYYKLVWEDAQAAQDYHTGVAKQTVSVGPWMNRERTVTFTNRLENVSPILSSIIGEASLKIKERQTIETQTADCLVLHSYPVLDIPMGHKFVTHVQFTARSAGCNCEVEAVVSCGAGFPFGFAEANMVQEAEKSVTAYMFSNRESCLRRLQQRQDAPTVPPDAEQFFDALEVAAAGAERTGATLEQGKIVVADELDHDASLLLYLRHIYTDTHKTCVLLQSVEHRLQRISTDIASVRAVVAAGGRSAELQELPGVQLSPLSSHLLTAVAGATIATALWFLRSRMLTGSSKPMSS